MWANNKMNGKKSINGKDLEKPLGPMEDCTKVNTKTIKSMDMVFSLGRMAEYLRGIG